MPAWRSIDPLPVLGTMENTGVGNTEDDSLESMLERSGDNQNSQSDPVGSHPGGSESIESEALR
jgi:hypothetical protein